MLWLNMSFLKNKLVWLFWVTVFAHGVILLMDGIYAHSWLTYNYLSSNDFNGLLSLFKETGFILGAPAFFHWGIMMVFGKNLLFGYRLIAFISIFLSGVLVYKSLRRLRIFDDLDNFFVAALFITYPAFKTAFWEIIIPIYIFCPFIFLLGCYVVLFKKIWWRGLSLALFFISFYFNALLVYYSGFLLLLFLLEKVNPKEEFKKSSKHFILHKLDFILLPFVFFYVKLAFSPSYGVYASYNKILLHNPRQIVVCSISVLHNIYYSIRPLLTLVKEPIFVVTLLLIVLYILWLEFKKSIQTQRFSKELSVLIFGALLLFLAVFPHSAVGRRTDLAYESKDLFLVGLPMSLIIISLIGSSLRLNLLSKKVKSFLCLVLIGVFIVAQIQNYSHWQFKWIKERAMILQLSKMSWAKKYSTFFVTNNTFYNDQLKVDYYSPYELASIFKTAWKAEKWIGYDVTYGDSAGEFVEEKYFTRRYALLDYNSKGLKANLVIDYRDKNLDYETPSTQMLIAIDYFRYKYFQPNKMEEFFKNLIAVRISSRMSY